MVQKKLTFATSRRDAPFFPAIVPDRLAGESEGFSDEPAAFSDLSIDSDTDTDMIDPMAEPPSGDREGVPIPAPSEAPPVPLAVTGLHEVG